MGTYSILVVGDWRAELEPHLIAADIGNPFSPYITCTDLLDEALRQEYRLAQDILPPADRISFLAWLQTQWRSFHPVAADGQLDLDGLHRTGWIRLDAQGEVTEVIHRNRNAIIRYVCDGMDLFLLKPNAIGWEVDPYQHDDIKVTEGYASSARFGDIDFAAMRQAKVDRAPSIWDWAQPLIGGHTWTPYADIRARHIGSETKRARYLDSVSDWESIKELTFREWRAQPGIEELYKDDTLRGYWAYERDALLLPREQYILHCAQHASVLKYADVLILGNFFESMDEAELMAQLDNDTMLTLVSVKH